MENNAVLPYAGRRIVCAVAQKPWSDANDRTFCTLAPLFLDDGSSLQKYEFPSHGLVWWMVLPEDKVAAEPGRLLSVSLSQSREAGTPGKDFYQVHLHSVAEVNEHGFTELLELPDSAAKEPSSFLSRRFSLQHRPARLVYVVWQQQLYGPLLTKVVEDGLHGHVWIHFELPSQKASEFKIQQLPVSHSETLQREKAFRVEVEVSLNERAVHMDASQKAICQYILVPTSDLLHDMAGAVEVSLETDTHVVTRLTKRLHLLNRGKRGQLKTMLEELDKELETKEGAETSDAQAIVARIQAAIRADEQHAQQLTDAIINAGLLDSQVEGAVQRHVDGRTKEIEEQAKQRTEEAWATLNQLEDEKKALTESIQRQKEKAVQELQAERERFENETASDREELVRARQELEKREVRLEQHLQPVTERLESAQNEIVNQYLALSPLFERASPTHGNGNANAIQNVANTTVDPPNVTSSASGKAITNWSKFIDQRLWPILLDWTPIATRVQAELFHTCLLGCRCSLVPDPSWGTAYAKAVGGRFALVHVEPDWINLSRAWDGFVESTWHAACANSDTLYFLMFAGVDRAPTAAWALPMFGVAGEFSDTLPIGKGVQWPDNLRVLFSFDPGPTSFEPSRDFVCAAGAPSFAPCGTDSSSPGSPIDGHVPAKKWLTWARPKSANAADVMDLGDLDLPADENTWHHARRTDIRQLARILLAGSNKKEKEGTCLRIAKKIRLEWPLEYVKQDDERN